MDAFFASIEQRDHPEWRGKPLAVGGSSRRGVVAAASYEARQYGVKSAMPSSVAVRLCPHLIFAKSRFGVYREVSEQVRAIFYDYTDLVEPLSLDEAYLDVSDHPMRSATLIAQEIRQRIYTDTGLTASAGVSFCKFLAKIASDVNKPDGMTVITPAEAPAFLEGLPIERFHGIGKVTARKMQRLGIRTGKELKAWSLLDLAKRFGKLGRKYYDLVRANDTRPVRPSRTRKSIGAERTFSEDLRTVNQMEDAVKMIAERIVTRMADKQNSGRTLTLKLRTPDFNTITRSKTYAQPLTTLDALSSAGIALLHENLPPEMRVRLLGLSVSNLLHGDGGPQGQGVQLTFDF